MTIADILRLIANNVQKNFDAGKKAEYDAFWDVYQENGNRENYAVAFYRTGWNDTNFKPKYDIVPTEDTNQMFFATRITDLRGILARLGRKLDTSGATGTFNAFYSSTSITYIPELDLRNITAMTNTFGYCANLIEIDRIILNNEGSTTFNANVFVRCAKLKEVRFGGKIGQNGLTFRDCQQLSIESLRSILGALLLTISENKSITLSTSHRAKIEADAECTAYASAATNAGWTIAYN